MGYWACHGEPKSAQRVERELSLWFGLRHRNILPLPGFCWHDSPVVALVSPFRQNGHAAAYLRAHPGADPLRIVRLGTLRGRDQQPRSCSTRRVDSLSCTRDASSMVTSKGYIFSFLNDL